MSVSTSWPLPLPDTVRSLFVSIGWLPRTRQEAHRFYRQALAAAESEGTEALRAQFYELAREDFYFFVCYVLHFHDFRFLDNDWTFHMAREIQAAPWGFADFWPRAHMKTTLITVAFTLWDSLYNPELTTAIFSMTGRQITKIANQMMRFLELEYVKWIYGTDEKNGVLWEKPERQAPSWNIESGLVFRRKGNPRESTIEFHSILSLPTGAHFLRIRMDDLIDQRFTTNQEMVEKALTNFQLMTPLRSPGALVGLAGTRYDNLDAYHFILEQRSLEARVHYPTHNGELDGDLLLMTEKDFSDWCRDLGPYQTSCQMFQKPEKLSLRQFSEDWIQWWNTPEEWSSFNRYIIVDPASAKGKGNDFTAMVVVGLGSDMNVYLIDAIREQLDPSERADALMGLVKQYTPMAVFYEESGLSSDVHHMRTLMDRQQHHFNLYGVKAGGNKAARVETLQPLAKDGRLWMPKHLYRPNAQGVTYDVMQMFLRYEWSQWPKPTHDDMLDALCRVTDGSTQDDPKNFPIPIEFPKAKGKPVANQNANTRWDAATRKRVPIR